MFCKQKEIVALVIFETLILYGQPTVREGNHLELVINYSDVRDICGEGMMLDMGDVAVKSDF